MSGKYDLASSFRGGLAAADFLAEGVEISDPEQLTDMHDPSYAVVLPAIPYHVDNIAPDGTELLPYPYNFTFSGFSGSGGAMSATYVKSVTSVDASQYKFGATTTQDTFFPNSDSKILGVADKYLQFERMKSHWFEKAAAGSKYEALAKAQAAMYDFFNNHSETVKNKMNESSVSRTFTDEITAYHRDAVGLFDTTSYTWRYKISAAKPPSWLVVGGSIEENPVEIKGERNKYYISVRMRGDPVYTDSTNTYQPRHEEGNLFSYPSTLSEDEGYRSDAGLMSPVQQITIPKSNKKACA